MSAIAQQAQVAKTVAVSTGKVANAKSMMVWRPHGNKYVHSRLAISSLGGISTSARGAILDDREPFEGMTSSVDGRARAPHRDRARCDGLFLYSSIPSVDAVRAVASDRRRARLRSFNTRARVEALLRAPSSSADRREEEGRGLVVFTSHNS